jgi:E-phenylitaconyl-CoA hydratase
MTISLTVQDGIATVLINRPERLNAIDLSMRSALQNAWQTIANDPNIQVAIVTGAGTKAFSAGADLREVTHAPESFATQTFGNSHNDSLTWGMEIDKPLICAFNGLAMGGGLEIGLACDIRIASCTAIFSLPEVLVGTMPGSGGTQRLVRTVGAANALSMLLTGENINAVQALRIGLVSLVCEPNEVQDQAKRLALRIKNNAPLSVRAIKRVVRLGSELPLDHALEMERMAWGVIRDSEDRAEGRKAFSEKRRPNYKGR